MTERSLAQRPGPFSPAEAAPRVESGITQRLAEPIQPAFEALYRAHFRFVYRSVARLGVPYLLVDDAVQDVFMVVLRRMDQLRADSHERAWLFAIAVRVASDYRRTARRKTPWGPMEHVPTPQSADCPLQSAQRAEAGRWLAEFLDTLDDDKRAVFVLAEMEELSVPEVAQFLGVNVNTVYTRLRTVRGLLARRAETHGHPLEGGMRG